MGDELSRVQLAFVGKGCQTRATAKQLQDLLAKVTPRLTPAEALRACAVLATCERIDRNSILVLVNAGLEDDS